MVCLISCRTSLHFPSLSPLPWAISRIRVNGCDCVNSLEKDGSLEWIFLIGSMTASLFFEFNFFALIKIFSISSQFGIVISTQNKSRVSRDIKYSQTSTAHVYSALLLITTKLKWAYKRCVRAKI